MADKGHHAHDDRSSGATMDITDKVQTWVSFWNATKYSVAGILALAILLAVFRTHNGMY
jgi:hypothetical protein